MNYKRKRIGAGLSAYTMSKELHVPYEKYLLVEKKQIPLEGSLLDRFHDALKNAKMIKFNHKQKMHDIKRAIDKGELRDRMSKMGYNGMTLARELGIAPSEVSHVLNNKNSNDERVEMVYDFLMNPLNKNVDESNTNEVIDMTKTKELIKEKLISSREIADALGISVSGVFQFLGKYYENRSDEKVNKQKQKIIDFVNNYEPKKEVVKTEPIEKDETQTVIERVKAIKDRDGLSVNDIATECGLSVSQAYRILNGYRGTSPASLKALKDFADKYENYEDGLIDVDKIKEIIKTNNLRQQDIEEELKISKGYLSKILNGTSKPSKVLADEIKEYFAKYEKSPQIEEINEDTTNILDNIETHENETKNNEIQRDNEEVIEEQLDNKEYIKDEQLSDSYFDLLKENYQLKHKLDKAEHQIKMYEILIERLK